MYLARISFLDGMFFLNDLSTFSKTVFQVQEDRVPTVSFLGYQITDVKDQLEDTTGQFPSDLRMTG